MAQQIINTGTAPNDGTGDTLKTSFTKTNANFTELYTRPLGNAYTTSPTAPSSPNPGDFWYDTTTGILASYVNDGNSSQWVEVSPSVGNIASAGAFINIQKFTASGVYTPTPGTQFAVVEVVGGGGGGAGCYCVAGQYYSGGGGGSGGYSRSVLSAALIGASQPITIGAGGAESAGNNNAFAGGATSFGSLVIANGGGGGRPTHTGVGAGGVGGSISGAAGDIVAAGDPGGQGAYSTDGATVHQGGEGGSSVFGGGGQTIYVGAVNHGSAGSNYGSGGSGGFSNNQNAVFPSGGPGSAGIVVVTEYNIGPGQQGPQGLAGGVTTPLTPQGRLTLQSTTPVMSTSVTGATIVYYTPYVGNQIPIWNGTSWTTVSFNELSIAAADTIKNPSAIGASKVNDWFVWLDNGVLRLSHGPDWNTATARGVTSLTRRSGIWLIDQNVTNGPASFAAASATRSAGTYVGTTRSNASSQFDWRYGTIGNTLVCQGFLGVWNAYNRVDVASISIFSPGIYSVVGGFTQNSIVHQCSFVSGFAEDTFRATYNPGAVPGANYITTTIGLDITGGGTFGITGYAGACNAASPGMYAAAVMGFHFVTGMEFCSGTGSVYGVTTGLQCGFMFEFRM